MTNSNRVIIENSSLNASTVDNLFEKIEAMGDGSASLQIDMRSVQFVDPYGLVTLCLVARHLSARYKRLSLFLPDNFDCQAYLYATKFVPTVEEFLQIENVVSGAEQGQSLKEEVVLELTKIKAKGNAKNGCVKTVLERLSLILRDQLYFNEKEITSFSTIVSELCYNIIDHSKDEGLVAVQRYQRKSDEKRFVIIGVGDLGVGIKESLGQRYDVSQWSHLEAIIQALKKEFSALPNRGLGLYMVSKIIKDYAGTLHIRSGDARLYLRHNPRGVTTALFPGTQISISLSELAKENI